MLWSGIWENMQCKKKKRPRRWMVTRFSILISTRGASKTKKKRTHPFCLLSRFLAWLGILNWTSRCWKSQRDLKDGRNQDKQTQTKGCRLITNWRVPSAPHARRGARLRVHLRALKLTVYLFTLSQSGWVLINILPASSVLWRKSTSGAGCKAHISSSCRTNRSHPGPAFIRITVDHTVSTEWETNDLSHLITGPRPSDVCTLQIHICMKLAAAAMTKKKPTPIYMT